MIETSGIKAGAVLRFDKDLFKVLEAGMHSGAGRGRQTRREAEKRTEKVTERLLNGSAPSGVTWCVRTQ